MMNFLAERFAGSSGILGILAEWAMAKTHEKVNDRVIALLNLQPRDRVLEIDFGPGYAIRKIASLLKQGFVAGITSSESLWRHARARNEAAIRTGNVELKLGTALAIPYPDDCFDKAFTVNSIETWLEPTNDLQEIERVVKPGGRLVVAWQPFQGEQETEAQYAGLRIATRLQEAGWMDVKQWDASAPQPPMVCVIGTKPQ